MKPDDTGLRGLRDRTEITDLIHHLGQCLDEGRFNEMRSLLVDDATVVTPGGGATGRDAVIAQAARNHTAHDRIQHLITDPLVEVDGDSGTVRANLVVHFATSTDRVGTALAPPPRLTLGQLYRFDVVRTRQGWRLARIELTPIWAAGSQDLAPAAMTPDAVASGA
jgi:hypothetical protein